jgi:chromosome segregation ATPase
METNHELTATIERLAAAATLLEETVAQLAERQRETEASIGRISATVESTLEERLAAAEARIAELTASAASSNSTATVTNSRKTLPAGMATLLSKQGVTIDSIEAGALDAALANLSIEQRIAVKSQLLRAGLLG